jgi:hypothetical protein
MAGHPSLVQDALLPTLRDASLEHNAYSTDATKTLIEYFVSYKANRFWL